MNILIVTAHPRGGGHTHIIGKTYEEAARKKGHEIQIIDLYDPKNFLPYLTLGGESPETKANVARMQSMITWAHELVIVHPIWWGTCPAILKNWIDSVFVPRFAYKYYGNESYPHHLLKGKTAKVFMTAGGPGFIYKFPFTPPSFMWKFGVFGFAGMKVIDFQVVGKMDMVHGDPMPAMFQKFLKEVEYSAENIH